MSSHRRNFRHGRLLLHLLEKCSTILSSKTVKCLHALSVTIGRIPKQSIFVHNNILSSYISLGEVLYARKMFNGMPLRTIVSYNILITAYCRLGDVDDALDLLSHMRRSGFAPTQYTLTGLLSCEFLNLSLGAQLQALSIRNGLFDADSFVGTALLGLFGRHGCWEEVFSAFECMPQKSLVTWNSMISLLGRNGFVEECKIFFHDLVRTGMSLSEGSFVAVLSGLVYSEEDLEYGEQIHGLMVKCGFSCEITALNSLISAYVRCKAMFAVERLFEQVPVQNVVSWNIVMDALVKGERPMTALELFLNILSRGLMPTQVTFVAVIESCSCLRILVFGESVHAKVIRSGFETDVIVGTALIDFYAKCDKLISAHKCFDQIEEKNLVSWNALIVGYSNICSSIAILLLKEMLQLGYSPNEFSFSAVTKSSSASSLHQLHGLIIRAGYASNEYVLSSLVMSYTRNGLINEALSFVEEFENPLPVVSSNIIAGIYNKTCQYYEAIKLLSLLEEPDVASWNIVISAWARSNDYDKVFALFKHMHSACILPDSYTFMSVLSGCTKLCRLDLGSSLHGLAIKTNLGNFDTFFGNVLIDMYGKCGTIDSAVKVFEEIMHKNIITWTTLITALGLNGYAYESVMIFRNMEMMGLKPDALALRAVLSSCRYGGLVEEALEIFRQMRATNGMPLENDHYHIMVDVLAKNGQIREAEKIIASMPFPPNASIWRSFLEGYRMQ
ncbi:pentatricopeptide repeat-containing protein At3g58590 [Vigna radiata var. radiata]|uniref:Pentatricopeptide repeat-containing protein At3g58590 n=1 Tax=Vigna radiata var. radiata TaxID=3916 RepID=A0A1S3W1C7_VIGRR|nr:pentatricopeptide repeat-containing protein At3g58590 [Vigna radiata var. radiata]